ncbi:MAG: OmpH family outer membrane protein [Opitutaceae bacterium]|jgi:outer membrane protein|nr:OmpH family outer membrane protein [Opitutaceae bacterium]
MNKLLRPLLAMAALAASSTALLAQPAVKLITVDIGKVFDGHYKSEEANAKFRDAEQKAREQAEELRKQGQTMVDEYKELAEQAKNTLLNADARTKAEQAAQKKLEEIQRKQADLQGFLQNTQNSLSQRIATHRDLLLEEITKTVNEIARRKGATLVLDKSGPSAFRIPVVLYADPAYDITDEVLAEVNKDRPAATTAAKPAAPATTAPAAGFTVPNVSKPADPAKKP